MGGGDCVDVTAGDTGFPSTATDGTSPAAGTGEGEDSVASAGIDGSAVIALGAVVVSNSLRWTGVGRTTFNG